MQITASHNPATDNGYKVYFDGGLQIISPTDREIEAAIADRTARRPDPTPARRPPPAPNSSTSTCSVPPPCAAPRRSVRVALTAMHGVGGELALRALHLAGFDDVHIVATQFTPDPDFPTVAFPNPEEPGATDALLALAARVGADIAIALDPDADRCAVGIPTVAGWRMLSGDETGWLLGDYILSDADPERRRRQRGGQQRGLLPAAGARSPPTTARAMCETLTGFKWLARADAGIPGAHLVYAYEEAIGHCVDPAAVRDKDGISAAVLACDLVAALGTQRDSVPDALDRLALRHGVHTTAALSRRGDDPQRGGRDDGAAANATTRPSWPVPVTSPTCRAPASSAPTP